MSSTQPAQATPRRYQLFIDGHFVEAESGKTFKSPNPATGETFAEVAEADKADVDKAVAAARKAFDGKWSKMSARDRGRLLYKLSQLIEQNAAQLAELETKDNGKPIKESTYIDLPGVVENFEYFAGWPTKIEGETIPVPGQMFNYTLREPVGVCGQIIPWNFPLLMAAWKLAPALACGNTVVLKPAEQTPVTALELAKLIQEAGFPEGVVNIIPGYGETAGAALASHPGIDKIAFTGSTEIGKLIAKSAAANLTKVSLELGGKAPNVIFADADLNAALDAAVFGICFNMGECCNSGSRLLIERSIYEDFTQGLISLIREVKVGDPLDESTQIGAIVNDEQLDKILHYIEEGQRAGASLRIGGRQLKSTAGRFVEPTIFSDVRPDMAIAREEIFGPVLSVLPFDHADDAIAIANSTAYGLSAAVWTRDLDRAFAVSRGVRAGTVWINTFMEGPAELPFGGYKQSGLGRELGRSAIEEFTDLKTIQVHFGPRTGWWVKPRS